MKRDTSRLTELVLVLSLSLSTIIFPLDNGVASDIVPMDAVQSGWYSSHGLHDAGNSNTLTGAIPDYYWGGTPCFSAFNSFFVFDLRAVSGIVTGAVLRLDLSSYESPDTSKSFTVYDVSTSISDLLASWGVWDSTEGQAIYSDLGSGVAYGTAEVSSDRVGEVLEINLSPAALRDLNDSQGTFFAVGISLDHIGSTEVSEWIRFREKEEMGTPQLILTVKKPEITITPESINYGNVPTGNSVDQNVTIQNDGDANLMVGTILAPQPPFVKLSDLCSNQSLIPRASCTVTFRFMPTTTGFFTSTLNIPSDDSDKPTVTVQLEGVSGPYLTAEWVYLDKVCKEGKAGIKCKIKGSLAIQNTGTQAAPSSSVRFYLSSDDAYDSDDGPALKRVATGQVKIGQIKTKAISYSFPTGETLSGKYIIAVVEAPNTVVEADEAHSTISCAIP